MLWRSACQGRNEEGDVMSHQHAQKRRRQPRVIRAPWARSGSNGCVRPLPRRWSENKRAAEPELPMPLAEDPLFSSRVDNARAAFRDARDGHAGRSQATRVPARLSEPGSPSDPARFAHERKEPAVLLHDPGRAPSPSGAISGDSRHGADHGRQALTSFGGGPAAVIPKSAETHMAGLVSGLRDTSGRCQ